jgi:HEAT repeat protein
MDADTFTILFIGLLVAILVFCLASIVASPAGRASLIQKAKWLAEALTALLASARWTLSHPMTVWRFHLGRSESRLKAITELERIGDRRAVDLLIRAFHDRDGEIPMRAAAALVRLADPRAIPAFEAALNDREEYIRSTAAAALEELRR